VHLLGIEAQTCGVGLHDRDAGNERLIALMLGDAALVERALFVRMGFSYREVSAEAAQQIFADTRPRHR
jgi:hypothetical protein